jgi:inactivated superfamily I helicase
MSAPKVFALPPGVPVPEAFARGFRGRHGGADPLHIARTLILANTPRARRRIEEALADAAPGSRLLPRVAVLTDLGGDPLGLPDTPPAIEPMRRHLRLVRLVEAYLGEGGAAAAPDLADALEALLDELDEEGLGPEALEDPTEGLHAEHWARMRAFVDLVRQTWPAIRAEEEGGAPDPVARQRLAVEARIAAWQAAPPDAPVIAAGSTGARATTARLLAAVARLPTGAVVLPGLDTSLPPDIHEPVAAGHAPEHPQAPFARLLGALGIGPGDIEPWDAEMPAAPRLRLLREALRPAPVTDAWQARAPALAREAEAATAGLALIEAANAREEAGAIAVAIREALETPGRRVALVTPDAQLARRVTAELARFSVIPDDSLGRPLANAPPAVFLRLLAEAAALPPEPVRLAGLLQHPLMRAGTSRRDHLALARAYEREVLRRDAGVGLRPGALPPWPGAGEAGAAWHGRVAAALGEVAGPLARGAPLAEVAAAHRTAAEALSREGPEAAPVLWEGSAGEAARGVLDRLGRAADAHGPGPVAGWPALLANLLGRAEIRPDPATPHPRVAILGPREARTEDADLVILAGLVDGVWPALPAPDPWLSRPMRAAAGLPPPESLTGLSAHDFYHAAARPEVVLARAERRGGAPTVPSRWLVRLASLMGGLAEGRALAAMRARGDRLLVLARRLHRPEAETPPAPRPRPSPPQEARPRTLSVTEVERLVTDAYSVYARRVLDLRPAEPLGRLADARDRGEVIHAVLERFVRDTADALPEGEAARARLLEVADAVLAEQVPWPDLRRVWRARLLRAADWFLAGEAARRAGGRPAAYEVKGEHRLETAAGALTLTAKADRIDLLADGSAAIYDYKTGQPPGPSDIGRGRSHQLHLQAAMLAAGAFEGLEALEARRGAYIGLTGSGDGGREVAVEALAAEAPDHLRKVARLVARYLSDAPFTARGRPGLAHPEGDYDHLARRAEWEGR